MKNIKYVIWHTNQGDPRISSEKVLLNYLSQGGEILSASYCGHGHIQYVLRITKK